MSRKRWIKRILAGAIALGGTGCKQQIFMEPQDYQAACLSGLPKGLENNTQTVIPPSNTALGNKPATVNDPDRKARPITLKECLAIALEQGNSGFQTPTALGSKLEILPAFTGSTMTGTDSIRAFAIDPATQANELERSLSKFDVQWINSLTWQKVDNPTAAQFLTFSSQYDSASISSTLVKPLPTGGVAAITFDTNYTKYQNPNTNIGNFVNPNYVPQVQFTFEQPLLRLFGVEANQLAPSHPGSQLLNIQPSGGSGTQGILLQRIHVDQQKADFEIRVNYMLANVELAYWNLFAAYYNLYAQEEGLSQAFLGYRFTATRVAVGTDPSQNQDQAQAQLERFRRTTIDARGQVLESERQLRGLLGLRSDDGTRLVPIDEPNLAPYVPDFQEAANEAIANRPEILQCRQDLKVQQLNLLLQKNLRRPDLRLVSQYSVQALGTHLDGPNYINAPLSTNVLPGNALGLLGADQYQNWTIGLRMTMPLGFRDANALVHEGQLSLARSYYQLRDTELKVLEYLVQQYRQVVQTHADIAPARAERESLQRYIKKIETLIAIGKWNPQDFLNYLTVQQQLATAIATEFQAIANYNNALATFEFAKGTIKQYNNVSVAEGPLPPWAQKKARDHFQERAAALKTWERSTAETGVNIAGGMAGQPVGPAVGTGFIENVPPLLKQWDTIPDVKDAVDPKTVPPMPKPVPPGPVQPGLPPGGGVPPTATTGLPPWVTPPSPVSQPQPLGQPQMQLPARSQVTAPAQQLPAPAQQLPAPVSTVVAPPTAVSEATFRPSTTGSNGGVVTFPARAPGGGGGYVPITTPDAVPTPPVPSGPAARPAPPSDALPQLPAGTGMNPLTIPSVGQSTGTWGAPTKSIADPVAAPTTPAVSTPISTAQPPLAPASVVPAAAVPSNTGPAAAPTPAVFSKPAPAVPAPPAAVEFGPAGSLSPISPTGGR
jgi:outer membrane protein TolC